MKTRKEWKRPEGYNCPFFTTTDVAKILGLRYLTLSNKKEKFATEVTPGNYLWSEENILNLIAAPINAGNPNLKKKEGLKC